MNESDVLSALTGATDQDGTSLIAADDVAGVTIEDDWVLVVLRQPEASARDPLPRLHHHLARTLPGATIELRAERRVYRGGAGFGEGRHVIAVLGGKGGVGKSTVAVNLAITFWALGMSAGLLDGDLNASDIPHMLGVHPTERPRRRAPARGEGWRLPAAVVPPSQWRRPYGRHGLEIMSVGFVVPSAARWP